MYPVAEEVPHNLHPSQTLTYSDGRGSFGFVFRGRFRNCNGFGNAISEVELHARRDSAEQRYFLSR